VLIYPLDPFNGHLVAIGKLSVSGSKVCVLLLSLARTLIFRLDCSRFGASLDLESLIVRGVN